MIEKPMLTGKGREQPCKRAICKIKSDTIPSKIMNLLATQGQTNML